MSYRYSSATHRYLLQGGAANTDKVGTLATIIHSLVMFQVLAKDTGVKLRFDELAMNFRSLLLLLYRGQYISICISSRMTHDEDFVMWVHTFVI